MPCFSSNTSQLAMEVSLQWAPACVPSWEKSFPAKLSNKTTFKMDSILICTCLLVNQEHLVSGQQLDSTPRYTHISSVLNKANPEKIWTTIWIVWISMVHIKAYFPTVRPSNNKKTAKSTFLSADGGSFTKTTTRGISASNFRRFRQPIRSCGIVLTANQRYGQNLALTSTNVRGFVSGPILAVAVRENVWEPLILGLTSGYVYLKATVNS